MQVNKPAEFVLKIPGDKHFITLRNRVVQAPDGLPFLVYLGWPPFHFGRFSLPSFNPL